MFRQSKCSSDHPAIEEILRQAVEDAELRLKHRTCNSNKEGYSNAVIVVENAPPRLRGGIAVWTA
jgi:ribosomal protein L30E